MLKRTIPQLFIPNGIILILAIILLRFSSVDDFIGKYESYFPWVLGTIAVLLAWRFQRSRLLFGTGLLLLAEYALTIFYSMESISVFRRYIYYGITIILPLNFIFLAFLKERGIFTFHGIFRFIFIVIQPLIVYFLLFKHQEWSLEKSELLFNHLTGLFGESLFSLLNSVYIFHYSTITEFS